MEANLRELLSNELRRRHGFGMMEGKIKPVHVANALMRTEHEQVGRMRDIGYLMTATAQRESHEERLQAVARMLEANRERWGRLGEEDDLRRSVLATRVLPLLRTILATDNATFGKSPEFSSFSSPTALTTTRDASDDHVGEFVHRLWGGREDGRRLPLLNLLRDLTDPRKDLGSVDDLTAVLAPLSDDMRVYNPPSRDFPEADGHLRSVICEALRDAARDLHAFEMALRPNPIASLQRIVLLGALSVFFFTATRHHERTNLPRRVLFVDNSPSRDTAIAEASERSVTQLFDDARGYMAAIVSEALDAERSDWEVDAEATVAAVLGREKSDSGERRGRLTELLEELTEAGADIRSELPRRLVELLDGSGGRTLDGYLRLLGIRCGLLYPQQKNPLKRLAPMDRTLEVLVAGTFELSGRPLEYRDFLDKLYDRWRIVVGGRLEDAEILARDGMGVGAGDLAENSERFLQRLQGLGLARKLADSVAVVGMTESAHADA
ncbi:MAG: hypothetical protein U1E45_19040 [Geminicoccaceae bacterium]